MSSSRNIGPYEVKKVLGKGGMGVVYECWDAKNGRPVAVKTMHIAHSAMNNNDMLREVEHRFQSEMKVTAKLRHPNIIHFIDSGYDAMQGCFWIATELMEGRTVAEELQLRKRIPCKEALEIAKGALKGLEYIHTQGIIHRDIKPSNIFLHHGQPVLFDFGISADLAGSVATQIGIVAGTYAYMAPERIQGKKGDAKTDIYGLGMVLYEMLTGIPAFGADSAQALAMQIMAVNPKSITELVSGIPDSISNLVQGMIEKEPTRRLDIGSIKKALDNPSEVGGGGGYGSIRKSIPSNSISQSDIESIKVRIELERQRRYGQDSHALQLELDEDNKLMHRLAIEKQNAKGHRRLEIECLIDELEKRIREKERAKAVESLMNRVPSQHKEKDRVLESESVASNQDISQFRTEPTKGCMGLMLAFCFLISLISFLWKLCIC